MTILKDTPAMRGIFRSAYKAAGLTFDEASFLRAIKRENARDDATEEGGSDLASRIMTAIRTSDDFTEEDYAMVEQALVNAGLSDVSSPSEMASDAAIMKRRQRLYDAGKITHDHLRSPLPAKPLSAADQARFDEMFPDAGRLR